MIQKLLLVRVANSTSDLLDRAGVKSFAGAPLNVSPISKAAGWHDEAGLSHYAFELKDLKLKDWQALDKFVQANDGLSVHDHEGDVGKTLAGLGLRINAAAGE